MNRSKKLISKMQLEDNAAILLCNPSNMLYVAGYTGEGYIWISNQENAIVTDFRYTEQANSESPEFGLEMTDSYHSHEDIVNEIVKKYGITTVYYEDDTMTVKDFNKCNKTIQVENWKTIGNVLTKMRSVKEECELDIIEQACRITSEAFESVIKTIKSGMTEKDIAMALEFDMMKRGAKCTSFSTIVAAGANGSLPHAVPGQYVIKPGDMITMDFGAVYKEYCADMTRTVAFGEPSSEMRRVYDVVKQAQQMSKDAIAPGKVCKDIDAIARDFIDAQGYKGRFGHGLGHSLGIDIHEDPRFNTSTDLILEVGQVMTVEPGIYLPGVGGVRIEDTVFVTETGSRTVTLPTKELIIL